MLIIVCSTDGSGKYWIEYLMSTDNGMARYRYKMYFTELDAATTVMAHLENDWGYDISDGDLWEVVPSVVCNDEDLPF